MVEARDNYSGERDESGRRHGQGSYRWSSVFSYSGEWRRGVMHGHGVLVVGDSTIEGEFLDGEVDGVGVRTWREGNVAVKQYRGEFRRGEMWGRGEMATATDRYVGDFVANRFEGAGARTTAAKAVSDVASAWRKDVPGDRVEGTWVANRLHGDGALRELGGHAYDGGYVRGRREGRGRGAWAGGATYEGAWKDEMRDGDGTYACAQSGLRYEGPWDRDAPAARAVAASPSFVVAAPAEGKDGKRATQSKGKGKKDEAGADAVRVAPGEPLPPVAVHEDAPARRERARADPLDVAPALRGDRRRVAERRHVGRGEVRIGPGDAAADDRVRVHRREVVDGRARPHGRGVVELRGAERPRRLRRRRRLLRLRVPGRRVVAVDAAELPDHAHGVAEERAEPLVLGVSVGEFGRRQAVDEALLQPVQLVEHGLAPGPAHLFPGILGAQRVARRAPEAPEARAPSARSPRAERRPERQKRTKKRAKKRQLKSNFE